MMYLHTKTKFRIRAFIIRILSVYIVLAFSTGCVEARDRYDLIIRGGTVYDGKGETPVVTDIAVLDGRIISIGQIDPDLANQIIDVSGLVVAPGFINMLSWANVSLIEDGRGLSDLKQGVTLEVFGEGWTMGPWNAEMKKTFANTEVPMKEIPWDTLGEYLYFLERKGISPNIASFVGAETIRTNVIGYEDRTPTEIELQQMQELVRQSMREGALGIGSALAYTPGAYASTKELIALASAAGEFDGIYASHVRSLGDRLLDGIGELLSIAREADVSAHVYHLIAAGQSNWDKLDNAIALIEGARQLGLNITSDMHPYTRAGTTLSITTPPWARDGGTEAFLQRLHAPDTRARIKAEMTDTEAGWENAYLWSGPEGITLAAINNSEFEQYVGKTISEIAGMTGATPEDTVLDLLIAGKGEAGGIYDIYSEENIRKKTMVPWIAFMSDSPTFSAESTENAQSVHPRGYGTFARILGKYVREEQTLTLTDAIRRLSSFPAELLGIRERGRLQPGYYADITVFDPATIRDHATFDNPHQLSTGVVHVFVNGEQVIKDGQHTGALPGRIAYGPGWTGWIQ
jgi:N-acyl-D-amino-acid deacylase